ncbi:MAG: TolC family protein [Gammaproteobacteria bacterium]|nr:TolC family protein [Gammaproteobacteria bacterium]
MVITETRYRTKQLAWILLICLSLLSGCGGPDSPFRVDHLPPMVEDSDLEALHHKDPRISLPRQPEAIDRDTITESLLYAPRPYLLPDSTSAIQTRETKPEKSQMSLSLPETILLGLRQNNTIQSAYLSRVVERFSLYISEEEFEPRWTAITGSASRADSQSSNAVDLGTGLTWETPYGTNLGLNLSTNQDFPNTSSESSTATTTVTATLEQPLLKGFGKSINTASLRQARIAEAQNKLELRSSVSETITKLINAFFAYEGEKWNMEIARRSLKRSKTLLHNNRLLVKAGHMAADELIQTELSVSNAEIEVRTAENSLNSAQLLLLNLLSLDPDLELTTSMERNPKQLKIDLHQAKERAYKSNPNYLTQQLAIENAMLGLHLARDNLRWELDLVGGYAEAGLGNSIGNSISNMSGDPATWSVGLSLVIPLDMRDLRKDEVNAEVALEQAKLNLQDTRENLDSIVRNAVIEVEYTWQRLLISRRSLDLAHRTLKTEMKKLSVGKSSSFEVLARQLGLREAESTELNAVIAYHNSLANLDEILGTTLDTWQITLNDN